MAEGSISATDLISAINKREDNVIGGALAAWMNLPLPALKDIAATFMQNEELAVAIEKNLTAPKAGMKEDNLCKWFYQWYQIDAQETRRFVLRYVPQLIWVYLYNIANSEAPPGVEACLLCIYNQEVVERADMEIIFQPPTLSLPSYLHKIPSADTPSQPSTYSSTPNREPVMLQPPASIAPGGPSPNTVAPANLGQSSTLTENALRQFNKQVKSVTVEKALKPIDLATNSNRDVIIRIALQKYNSHISLFSPRSWIAYCKMCKRLVNYGFDFTITPIPLLKSKSFSKKYIEDDLDNLAIDSDEDVDDLDDDFGDELSDSDGEMKPRDVERGESSTSPNPAGDAEAAPRSKVAKSPQASSPGTPGKRRLKSSKETSKEASTSKVPLLSIPGSPSTLSTSQDAGPSSPNTSSTSLTTSTTSQQNNLKNSSEIHRNNVNNNNNNNNNNGQLGESTPKNTPNPPVRIILAPSCLQEMVTGLTFCLFKESYKEHALKAVRKIHLRACYDLMPEIILSANALLHMEFQDRIKNAPPPAQPGKTTPR